MTNKFLECYKDTTAMINFDINAGATIDSKKNICRLVNEVERDVREGKGGCCLHSSLILSEKLRNAGIDSEIICTYEPTYRNGKRYNDIRASVLYYDHEASQYFVANPVEDIEMFTLLKLDSSLRYSRYESDGTLRIPKSVMGTIVSSNASRIPVQDFIERYGDGSCWTLGNIFEKKSATLEELLNCSMVLRTDDFKKEVSTYA